MKRRYILLIVAALFYLETPWSPAPALAELKSTILTVDFENTPLLPKGPGLWGYAGPMQTITIPGCVTITGGVVLGNPVGFPAGIHSTQPNIYGTTDGFDYSPVITIAVDPGFYVNELTGYLFNGESGPIDYMVEAFNGSTIVDSQFFDDMPSNSHSGFGMFSLTGDPITRVEISGDSATNWNFFIDTVTFVPEPATLLLLGLGGLGLVRRRRAG